MISSADRITQTLRTLSPLGLRNRSAFDTLETISHSKAIFDLRIIKSGLHTTFLPM